MLHYAAAISDFPYSRAMIATSKTCAALSDLIRCLGGLSMAHTFVNPIWDCQHFFCQADNANVGVGCALLQH